MAIVVAHPDDETLAAGGSWHLLADVLLIHVTDGVPRALDDAARAGFATPEAYGLARQAELQAALACGEMQRRVPHYGSGFVGFQSQLSIPDQDAVRHIPAIASALSALFDEHEVTAILTHAYEGGHPDHDAICAAVHRAAGPREIVEFPAYHAAPDGRLITGEFLPGPPSTEIRLSLVEMAQKRAMLACFTTQAEFLARFDPTHERFRTAPAYDFAEPPHPGRLNYENWGWDMTGPQFRALACA